MKVGTEYITIKLKNIFTFLLSFLLLFLYLANVKNISNEIIFSLKSCFYKIIPSLFPTLLISSIMLYANCFDSFFSSINLRFLGKCKKYISPILTGLLCGFISGARGVCEIFEKSKEENDDFSLAIALTSNAGLGFVIGVVGIKIWNDIYFGIYLYFVQITTAILVFLMFKSKTRDTVNCYISKVKLRPLDIISKAVNNATNALIIICSFTIFTSVLMGIITSIFDISPMLNTILLSIFDFSSAVFSIGEVPMTFYLFITGFSIGFAGLSVHLQTFTVCQGFPLKKGKFILFKLIQGLLCGGLSMLYNIF